MRYIKMNEVKQMTARGSTAIYKDISLGKFPKQIKIGASSFWIESEILSWMEKQASMRPA